MSETKATASHASIRVERPDQPEVIELIAALDAYAQSLYPPESNHLLDIDALCSPEVIFVVARENGVACGCGAFLRDARGWAEIKRMYVVPAQRGCGLGARILQALENIARREGLTIARLETGIHNMEALAAYRRAGYRERGPFGDYALDPLSVFMEKRLDADVHA